MPPLRPIDHWLLSQVLPFEARFVSAARRMVRNPEEARDLVQEAFTRLLVMEGWADIANPRAYVFRMVRNLAIERGRVHRLAPLEVPPVIPMLTAVEATAYSAVELFVERASASVEVLKTMPLLKSEWATGALQGS